VYGFYEEIQSRFNHGDSIAVYKAFNKVFRCFPLVALVAGEIIFVSFIDKGFTRLTVISRSSVYRI